jgi:hypothetical protein
MAPRSVGSACIEWVTKNLLSRAFPCLERHVKLVPAAVISTHQFALDSRGWLWSVHLM